MNRPRRSLYRRARSLVSQLSALLHVMVGTTALLAVCLYCLLIRKNRDTLIWGPEPMINYKYWSAAMREGGWKSLTVVTHYYSIHRREDFDVYLDDLMPAWLRRSRWRNVAATCFGLVFIIRNASVVHFSFHGGVLANTPLRLLESSLLRWAGIKTFVLPYGADAHLYSAYSPEIRNALLASYPQYAGLEPRTRRDVQHWAKHADAMLCGFMVDGIPRWDVPVPNMLTLDLREWQPKSDYSTCDGRNGPVRLLHSPNHRGAKGSEFVIDAVEKLRAEGLQVELVLLEKVPNEEIKLQMQSADILAEQLVLPGYGLNAIEGMASGLAVLSNLHSDAHTRLFRRYAFLDECPILSTTPELIKQNLRLLITSPALRAELGKAARQYAEKYYSYAAARELFGAIYRRLLEGADVDLINFYHPVKSERGRTRPKVAHPLVENRLPATHPAWQHALSRGVG